MFIKPHLNKIILLFSLVPIVLGDLGRFKLSAGFYINLADILVLSITIYGLITFRSHLTPILQTYSKWLLAIFTVMILSLLLRLPEVPLTQIISASLYPLRYLIYLALPLTLIPILTRHSHLVTFYTRSVILAFITLSLAGLLQLAIFPNLQFLEYRGYDPHYFRVVSTWLDPNFLGAGLVFASLFTLAAPTQALSKHQKLFTLTLLSTTLILTFSRSAYLMALVALVTYALLRRSWKIFLGITLACSITYLIFAIPRTHIETTRNIDRSTSANLRLVSYYQSYTFFTQHPLTGIGYNLTRYEKNTQNMVLDTQQGGNSGGGIDSSWLLILATTGTLGFITFLAFWIRQAYFLIDNNPHTSTHAKPFATLIHFLKKAPPIHHTAISLFIAWSLHAWLINSLFYAYLMIIWGIIFSFTQLKHKEH